MKVFGQALVSSQVNMLMNPPGSQCRVGLRMNFNLTNPSLLFDDRCLNKSGEGKAKQTASTQRVLCVYDKIQINKHPTLI